MSRTKPPKAVRSILYIQWKLRYYPSNNPRIFLATNVTKKLDHNTVHALEFSISKGMDPYCSLPALSTYMGHKGIESTEYYLRLTKQYFVNVLNYTQEQADTIFPEV